MPTGGKKAISIIRKYYVPFVQKIHPDYFVNAPIARTQNQTSLQHLNSILNALNEKELQPKNCILSFHLRSVREKDKTNELISQEFPTLNSTQPSTLKKPLTQRQLYQLLSFQIANSFLSLCEKAKLTLEIQDTQSVETEIQALIRPTQNNTQSSLRPLQRKKKIIDYVFGKQYLASYTSNPDIDISSIKDAHKYGLDDSNISSLASHLKEFFQNPSLLVHFSNDLYTRQRNIAMQKLYPLMTSYQTSHHYLEQSSLLPYEYWKHIPLFVTNSFSRVEPGILIIPWNFKLDELVHWLELHLRDIRHEFQNRIDMEKSIERSMERSMTKI